MKKNNIIFNPTQIKKKSGLPKKSIGKLNIEIFSNALGISEREFNSALEKPNFTNLRQTIFNTLEVIFKKDESKLKEIQLLRKNYS